MVFDRILNESPVAPISLNPQLPIEFETILNKTLEKDRELRCQFAGELRADLKRLQRKSGSGSGPAAQASGTSSPRSSSSAAMREARMSRRLAIVAACLVIIAAVGFGAWRFWPRPRPFTTISVSQITNVGTIERIALSGDGRFLAEVKNDKGQRTLWVRNIATNTIPRFWARLAMSIWGSPSRRMAIPSTLYGRPWRTLSQTHYMSCRSSAVRRGS